MSKRKATENKSSKKNKKQKQKHNNNKTRELANIQAQLRLAVVRGNKAAIEFLRRMYMAATK